MVRTCDLDLSKSCSAELCGPPTHRLSTAAVLMNLDEFEYICDNQTSFIQLAEKCGGEARTSRLVARRTKKHGPNVDLAAGIDPTEPSK